MRLGSSFAIALAFVAVSLGAPARPASSEPIETREQYFDRLRYVCEADCMQPRELLRTARRNGRGATEDVAGILDVLSVSEWNGKYLLHTGSVNRNDAGEFVWWGTNRVGQMTPFSFRPVFDPDIVVVELDRQTFFDILRVPVPGTGRSGEPVIDEDGNIIVSQDRFAKFSKPTLRKLRSAFRNRRIAVRGTPRLDVPFTGGRRDFRRKKLFIEVNNVDNLVLLPRFDKDGNPRPEDLPWLTAADGKDN